MVTADLAIDNVEYAILRTFHDLNRPLWKQRVYEYIREHRDDLPVDDSVSLKTVGKKIDRLKYEQYLEQTIATPDNTNRDQIIAYTLTDDGEDALLSHRNSLLRQAMVKYLFPDSDSPDMSQQTIVCLMQDKYEFDDSVKEQLLNQDRETVLAFLIIRNAQKEAVNILNRGNMNKYHDVLNQYPDIREGLGIQ